MTATHLSDAERMDRHYRYQRFIYDLTRTHYLIGRKHLIGDLASGPGETVLEIGCGTAWNLVRVAKRYSHSHVYGVDVSNAMLDTARAAIKRHGLASRICVAQADATNFSGADVFGIPTFNRIFFSYALWMIPGWQDALDSGVRTSPQAGACISSTSDSVIACPGPSKPGCSRSWITTLSPRVQTSNRFADRFAKSTG